MALTTFSVRLYTRERFNTDEAASRLVNYLLSNPSYAPDRFGQSEPLRHLSPRNISELISAIVNDNEQKLDPHRVISTVLLQRRSSPSCAYSINWSNLPWRPFEINHAEIDQESVRDANRLNDWLGFVFGLLKLYKAWYASFALASETDIKNVLEWRAAAPNAHDPQRGVRRMRGVGVSLEQGIPGVYWGNYFGPSYVDWFGSDKLESLSCTSKQRLDTGGLFFTTAPTPFEWNSKETQALQAAVRQHLGAEGFFDIETVRSAGFRTSPSRLNSPSGDHCKRA